MNARSLQQGFSYTEVIVVVLLLGAVMVPMLDALEAGLNTAGATETATREHYALVSRMEQTLALQYAALLSVATLAADTPSSLSDTGGTPERHLIFVTRYDPLDKDTDGDPFTVVDDNLDGDNDPFTGYSGPLWVRVQREGSAASTATLTMP